MSDWTDLIDLDGLRLAWNRIIRSSYGDTKDRVALRAFNLSMEANLLLIRDSLRSSTYQPSPAPKVYIPKKTGTLRTIPILSVTDRLVYQAMCDIVARKCAADISLIADRQVYAPLPASTGSLYALRPWEGQYRKFVKSLESNWHKGNRWLVKTDIAAFYDSIDHNSLIESLKDRWGVDAELLNLLKMCLRTWSPHIEKRYLEKGLPQGYEASDLLSSVFLNAVDREMCGNGYQDSYRRYVDDIRMLLPTEETAWRALIDLDLRLKSVGLVVQTAKTVTQKIENLDDQRDPQWGLLSMIDLGLNSSDDCTQDDLRSVFFQSVAQLGADQFAESRVVFTLARLRPFDDVKEQVFPLLEKLPARSAVMTRYLSQFVHDRSTISHLRQFAKSHKLYGWHLTNCLRGLSTIGESSDFEDICQNWIMATQLPWYQRLAAAECLSYCKASGTFCHYHAEHEQDPYVRKALLASCYRLADNDPGLQRVAIRKMLLDTDEELIRQGVYFLLSNTSLSWTDMADLEDNLGRLRALVPDLTPQSECYVASTLAVFFEAPNAHKIDFPSTFGLTYDAARDHLRIAVGAYDTSPSRYVSRIDNFNILLTEVVYKHCLPSVAFQKDEPVNNWNRKEFRESYPVVAAAFGECHKIRSNCAEPHPYSTTLGTISEEVTYKQRDRITSALKPAYGDALNALSR